MTASAAIVDAWDPPAVIAAAKELIHSSNYEKVNDARASVDRAIAQWVHVATSDPQVAADAALRRRAEQAIVDAWALYGALEIELRQFKQATKVFESGVSCAVAGPHASLWLAYAAFCVDRKKFSNARKVFVRALRAVPELEHGDLWTRFHAFVVEHLDPNMTLEALQAQVFPERNWSTEVQAVNDESVPPRTSTTVVRCDVPIPVTSGSGTAGLNGTGKPSAATPSLPVDPSLAFVDKKGDDAVLPVTEASVVGKRKAIDGPTNSPVKQAKTEVVKMPTNLANAGNKDGFFLEIPTTLPITPGCPHLLFDQMETQRPIGNELLEKLSHVLSDNAVFQGVKDLYENQRQRDRDMLYRWQDLVGTQMKEGSELFARHTDAEKGVAEPRALIELKAKHLEQRHEFVNRCQMSQHQFIEICEMDRVNALKAQQISLENMKIPEITVTTDPASIELQRAILCLILEAEKLSREESTKKAVEVQRPKKSHFTPKPAFNRPRSDSRDRDFHPRGGGRGGRGGGFSRGGGSFGRNGGFRRQFADSPPRGGRGPPRRHDGYAPHASSGPRSYDNGPRQSSFEGNQRNYAPGSASGRGYGDYPSRDRQVAYDRGQERRPQPYNRGPPPEVAAPPPRFADAPPALGNPTYGSQEPFRGANPHAGPQGGGRGAPITRHVEYDRGNRYGGAPSDGRGFSAQPSSRYGGEPAAAPARYGGEAGVPMSRYGGDPMPTMGRYGGEPLTAPNRYGGESSGPPVQQYSAQPPSYDYGQPASNAAQYGYDPRPHPVPQQHQQPALYNQPAPVYNQPTPAPVYQQPPPQQHVQTLPYQHQPPPQQQQPRGYGAPAAYQAPQPQPHQPPQQHRHPYQSSPPRGGGRGGYDRFRRGGGGGGRYGRR